MDERRSTRQPSTKDLRSQYENARNRLIKSGNVSDSRPSPLIEDATKPSHELFRQEERARAEAIRAMIEGGNTYVAELLVPPLKSKLKPKDGPQT